MLNLFIKPENENGCDLRALDNVDVLTYDTMTIDVNIHVDGSCAKQDIEVKKGIATGHS